MHCTNLQGGRALCEAVSKSLVRRLAHRAAPWPPSRSSVSKPGEPAVDRSEKIGCLIRIALVAQPRARSGRVRYCSVSDRIAALRANVAEGQEATSRGRLLDHLVGKLLKLCGIEGRAPLPF